MNTYDIGDLVRLSVAVTVDGTPTDPSTVICKVRTPDRTITTFTLGVDVALVRDSTGVYHLNWNVTTAGTHLVRWEGTGAAQAAEESSFKVRKSRFV